MLKTLHKLGLDRPSRSTCAACEVAPRDVVAAALPDPADARRPDARPDVRGHVGHGHRQGRRAAGDYLYHVVDNEGTMAEYGAPGGRLADGDQPRRRARAARDAAPGRAPACSARRRSTRAVPRPARRVRLAARRRRAHALKDAPNSCSSGSCRRSTETHPRSRALSERARSSLLAGVPMHWMLRWAGGFPVYAEKAWDARFRDVDGHRVRRPLPRRHRGDGGALARAGRAGGRGAARARDHADAAERGRDLGRGGADAALRPRRAGSSR